MKTLRCEGWARREFGDARLGDRRRTERLVRVAAQSAATPAGKVTAVFSISAEREGAYRLLENDDVAVEEIARAAHRATARKCFGHPYAFVGTDGSSLNLPDPDQRKRLGAVGTRKNGAQGLIVLSALAVLPDGTPAGLCGQRFWTRPERAKRKKNDRRKTEEKETRHWLDVMEQTKTVFAQEAPSVRPWFQEDRGADAWPVLLSAVKSDTLLTVRAAHDRRLMGTFDGRRDYLWPHVERQEPAAFYRLAVPPGPNRQARSALIQIQFCAVVLDLRDVRTKTSHRAPLWAVRAVEVETTPMGEKPIEWMLLTTYPVRTLEDAQLVLVGYTTRWRIEEFHKAWKTGACRVEDTLLEDRDHIERWATIQASVAARLLRLTYLSRTAPELPATVELSRPEIDAVILLREPKGIRRGATPSIDQITRWLADLGGYTGKSSGGPPGFIVIGRGLRHIESAAILLSDGGKM